MAEIVGSVKINASEVIDELKRISDVAEKTFVSVLNDAAFELRKTWGELITANIDRPSAFSKRTFVEKATTTEMGATVFIPPLQSEYLSLLVEGGTRKPGDYGTYPDQILAPVNVKLNKSGNFPAGGPKRWLGAITDGSLGKDVFIGAPNEFSDSKGGGKRAVYAIKKDGGLNLLAVFVKAEPYKKTLPLYDAAEKFNDIFFKKISDRIDELLNGK